MPGAVGIHHATSAASAFAVSWCFGATDGLELRCHSPRGTIVIRKVRKTEYVVPVFRVL
jgi:hypothetical protein